MTSVLHAQAQLSTALSSVVQTAIHNQRIYTETEAEQLVRDGVATGMVELEGSGETIVNINFPIQFLEKPIFTAGFELRSAGVEWGKFPMYSATVITFISPTLGDTTYTGASLAIVTFNAPGAYLHYSFAGRSYTTPTDTSTSVTQTL